MILGGKDMANKLNLTTPENPIPLPNVERVPLEVLISETFEEVKNSICNDYCRYPLTWDEEKEGYELYLSEYCENCPLNKL